MAWYFFRNVKRITGSIKLPWFLWMIFLSSYILIIQEGIEQINDKGETRILWKK